MRRTAIKPRQELPGFGRNDGHFIILASKRSHGIERVKPHDGDELYAIIDIPAQQMYAPIALDGSFCDALKYLNAQ
jgi:hypothetical protein